LGQNDLEALEAFTRAIELNPRSAKAYYFRGITQYFLSDYSRAIEDFDKAMELDPRYRFHAYFNRELAKTFLDESNCNRAI
jgi:tetratricopeptide (TPR) repeat protein